MRIAEQHDALLPAGIALAAAAVAAVLLQGAALAAHAPEGVAEVLWLLGVVLGAWGALAVAGAIALLWRRRRRPAAATRTSATLAGAAVALLALTAWLHPIVGAGGGVG